MFLPLFVSACEKESLESPTAAIAAESVEMVDGVTVSFVDGLAKIESIEDAAKIENFFFSLKHPDEHPFSFPSSFVSAHRLFNSIDETDFEEASIPAKYSNIAYLDNHDGDLYLEATIKNYMLKHLANGNGQLVVGDELITVRQNRIVKIPLTEINDFGEQPELSPNATSIALSNETIVDLRGTSNLDVCKQNFSPRRRVRGELEKVSDVWAGLEVCTYNAVTKLLRRGFLGIYYPKKGTRFLHSGEVTFDYGGQLITESFSVDQTQNINTLTTNITSQAFPYGLGACNLTNWNITYQAYDGVANGSCDNTN